tara:strand:+ start:174 stop:551 length:378 start_codon:yes stop_codon:yes gene_type:complete
MPAFDMDAILEEAFPNEDEEMGDPTAITLQCKKCKAHVDDFQLTEGYCSRSHMHYVAGTHYCPNCDKNIGYSQVDRVATSPEGQKFLDHEKAVQKVMDDAIAKYHAANPPQTPPRRRRRRVRRKA